VDVPFYQYQRNEAGLFTELYLPKRAEFQGTLYKVLTEGFDLDKLKAHFRDPHRQPGIRRMLRGYSRVENYTDVDVEELRPLFFGYSLYEVDGVYHSPARGIIEERTQVIRFLLKPDVEELLARCEAGADRRGEAVLLAREFLRSPTLERESFLLAEGSHITERLRDRLPNYLAGVDYLDRWMNQVRMFLFGYVVYEICARILELHREERLSAEQLEEEIWFASFSNLSISRVTRGFGGEGGTWAGGAAASEG
jgi:hypothetical protein